MPVPAEIRAVPRPKNTIVEDNGREGPNRYSVRERTSTKYVAGSNPQPHNGKVIGHIIDFKFVPKQTAAAVVKPDMRSKSRSSQGVYTVGCLFDHVDCISEGDKARHCIQPDVH